MSRGQSAAAIILLSATIFAAAVVGIAALRMLTPFVADSLPERGPLGRVLGGRTRAALEREKALTLRSIKELEFDRAMGKVSDVDFAEMAARLRAKAGALIQRLDAGSTYREQIEQELSAPWRRGATADQCQASAAGAAPPTTPTRGSASSAARAWRAREAPLPARRDSDRRAGAGPAADARPVADPRPGPPRLRSWRRHRHRPRRPRIDRQRCTGPERAGDGRRQDRDRDHRSPWAGPSSTAWRWARKRGPPPPWMARCSSRSPSPCRRAADCGSSWWPASPPPPSAGRRRRPRRPRPRRRASWSSAATAAC